MAVVLYISMISLSLVVAMCPKEKIPPGKEITAVSTLKSIILLFIKGKKSNQDEFPAL